MTIEKLLSDRTHEVEWSGIRIMFALADEIPDVVNLGIGQPDFDTPEFIRDAAKQALDLGQHAIGINAHLTHLAVIVQLAGRDDLAKPPSLPAGPAAIGDQSFLQDQGRHPRLEQFYGSICRAGRRQQRRFAISMGRSPLAAALKQVVAEHHSVRADTIENCA